jgi:hypothetical protein
VKKELHSSKTNQEIGLGGINLNKQVNDSDLSSLNKITKNIPYRNPTDLLKLILSQNKEELNKFLTKNRAFELKPEFDLLLDFPSQQKVLFPKLSSVSKYLTKLLAEYNNNYQNFLQAKLYSGIGGMIDAQRAGVLSFLSETDNEKVVLYKKLKIKDVYKDDQITEEQAEMVIFALETASELIPDKYKKKVKPVTLLIRTETAGSAPCATIEDGEFVIVLNFKKNNIIQTAEAFHEYVHLVEKANPELMKASNAFLKSRVISNKTAPLEDLGRKYRINYSQSAAKIHVYPGRFLDGYAGRTYGDLFENKPIPTEILSIGVEALFLDPIGFFIKDHEHYELVKKFLSGLL